MRGKVIYALHDCAQGRITPACAGKSRCILQQLRVVKDHPRMCGEKLGHTIDHLHTAGSPPHVRGKEVQLGEIDLQDRITPACAGKSSPSQPFSSACRDHPRMCGEKGSFFSPSAGRAGSPPHVRGKEKPHHYLPCVFGITPACAGKSRRSRGRQAAAADHPRMCGEKLTRRFNYGTEVGSPPHVRGKALPLPV